VGKPMNKIQQIFASKILQIRGELSYRDFSKSIKEKTGVSIHYTSLRSYERTDGVIPRTDFLDALAQYAGVKPSWFFEDEFTQTLYIPPEMKPLAQAGQKMSSDQRNKLVKVARIIFPEAFEDDGE
jgi:transcriptional regulator with XRE-family HTH domain